MRAVKSGTGFFESDPYGRHSCFRPQRKRESFGTPGGKKAPGFRKPGKNTFKDQAHTHWLRPGRPHRPLFRRSRKKCQSVVLFYDRQLACRHDSADSEKRPEGKSERRPPPLKTAQGTDQDRKRNPKRRKAFARRAAAPAFRRREKAGAAAARLQTSETSGIDQTPSKTERRCEAHTGINRPKARMTPPEIAHPYARRDKPPRRVLECSTCALHPHEQTARLPTIHTHLGINP